MIHSSHPRFIRHAVLGIFIPLLCSGPLGGQGLKTLKTDPHAKSPAAVEREAVMKAWGDRRLGLMVHFGPYSKLGGTWQGKHYPGFAEWIMKSASISRADYRQMAGTFDPKQYDPKELVTFAKNSGFKYMVFTAKHHDGFAMFDSKVSDFDSVDVLASKRDLLKEFAGACKEANLPLGYFFSIDADWYHPGGGTRGRAWDESQVGKKEDYFQKIAFPQVRELITGYGPVAEIIFDRTESIPDAMAKRFGAELGSTLISAETFKNSRKADYQYMASQSIGTNFGSVNWEKFTSTNDSMGYRAEPVEWKPTDAILKDLVSTATQGGNLLINVALDGEGALPEKARKSLGEVGQWMQKYGDSIYGTCKSPFVIQSWIGGSTLKDRGQDGSTLFIHLFETPGKPLLLKNLLTKPISAKLMGTDTTIPIGGRAGAWTLDLASAGAVSGIAVVEVSLPSLPKMGSGPVTPDAAGNYPLSIAKGDYTGKNTAVGRTVSSADLRVTGFSDESESGTWEFFSDKASTVKLSIKAIAGAATGDKKLVVYVNGEKVDTFSGSPPEFPGTAGRRFESKGFQLPLGVGRVTISGTDKKEEQGPLTVLEISLVKTQS